MRHALIIDDNMIVSRAIQNRLGDLGFTSFDQTWTENQAVAAANHRPPDLVVIGDEVETGSALGAARRISHDRSVPVLMVTGDPVRAERRLARLEAFEGPFLLNQIEEAVKIACTAPDAHFHGSDPRLVLAAKPSHLRVLEQADKH